jgi:hypothetical protein
MLLRKQEKDGKIKTIYNSSNICASTYEKDTKGLTIIFTNGGQYRYIDVSQTDYTRFELADSQGSIFNSHIKKYTFEKLDKVDVKEIINEITVIKDQEEEIKKKYITNKMIESVKGILTYYETTSEINLTMYDLLKKNMVEFETTLTKKQIT